jgi:hypothetical protein
VTLDVDSDSLLTAPPCVSIFYRVSPPCGASVHPAPLRHYPRPRTGGWNRLA